MVSMTSMEQLVPVCYLALLLLQIVPNFAYVPPYAQMLFAASCTVFIGCVRSANQAKVDEHGNTPEKETMQAKDAYMFPVIGSCVLFGLYLLIKFIDKTYLNALFGLYFGGIGVAITVQTLSPILRSCLPVSTVKGLTQHTMDYQIPLTTSEDYKIEGDFTYIEVATAAVGIVFGIAYLQTKHWVLNNIFGVMFSIQGIEFVSLGSVKVGVILLIGLFFYDIFWVFATEVMVTVATGFKAPIKLQFPKNIHDLGIDEEPKFSIVGLGDIVIPGIYVALMLRYDNVRDKVQMKYFPMCMSGYVAGLVATIAVMHFFQAAQPALLYLVPACLASTVLPAFLTGEVKDLFEYSEEEKEKEAAKSDDAKKDE